MINTLLTVTFREKEVTSSFLQELWRRLAAKFKASWMRRVDTNAGNIYDESHKCSVATVMSLWSSNQLAWSTFYDPYTTRAVRSVNACTEKRVSVIVRNHLHWWQNVTLYILWSYFVQKLLRSIPAYVILFLLCNCYLDLKLWTARNPATPRYQLPLYETAWNHPEFKYNRST